MAAEQPFAYLPENFRMVGETFGRLTISVVRTGDLSQAATVHVRTSGGDAVEGYDYLGLDQPLAFAPGETTASFYLTILDDHVSETLIKSVWLETYQGEGDDLAGSGSAALISITDDELGSQTPLALHAFGDDGLWTYNVTDGYHQINDVSPQAIYPAPGRGAYLDFGPSGLWSWEPLRGYAKLTEVDPRTILPAAHGDGLAADFGPGGLWSWDPSAGWARLNDLAPRAMTGTSELGLADYGDAGLWAFTPTSWTKLADAGPDAMVPGGSDFYLDYGDAGLWSWSPDTGLMDRINPADPGAMTMTSQGLAVVLGDAGLWRFDGGWTRINESAPTAMFAGGDGLILGYGAAFWRLWPNGQWGRFGQAIPGPISYVPAVGYYPASDAVDVGLGAAGLWRWTVQGGWSKLTFARPTALGATRADSGHVDRANI